MIRGLEEGGEQGVEFALLEVEAASELFAGHGEAERVCPVVGVEGAGALASKAVEAGGAGVDGAAGACLESADGALLDECGECGFEVGAIELDAGGEQGGGGGFDAFEGSEQAALGGAGGAGLEAFDGLGGGAAVSRGVDFDDAAAGDGFVGDAEDEEVAGDGGDGFGEDELGPAFGVGFELVEAASVPLGRFASPFGGGSLRTAPGSVRAARRPFDRLRMNASFPLERSASVPLD